jgi:hypothetical protein
MDPLFLFVESSALSTFIRESASLWVFPFILILHTVGLAFFVGVNLVWDVRLLGAGAGVPLASLERYVLAMWLGFWINAVSGVLLLIAYPTKALTNPVFYLKLSLIGVGLVGAMRLRRYFVDPAVSPGMRAPTAVRVLAAASVACWIAVIFAGRFLAYTCTRLTVDFTC